ncbi:hypothetical protein Tco_1130336 [Tanacetum coccineum]
MLPCCFLAKPKAPYSDENITNEPYVVFHAKPTHPTWCLNKTRPWRGVGRRWWCCGGIGGDVTSGVGVVRKWWCSRLLQPWCGKAAAATLVVVVAAVVRWLWGDDGAVVSAVVLVVVAAAVVSGGDGAWRRVR